MIKATRLQAWAPAGGEGVARVRRRPPPPLEKKIFWAILGAFLLLFFHMGAFLLRFSHFGGLFTMHVGAFLLLFTSWWRPFLGLPPPTKTSAGAHDCKEGSRVCSPEIFLCDHNLVNSGHVTILP